jgi:hypothetical protein
MSLKYDNDDYENFFATRPSEEDNWLWAEHEEREKEIMKSNEIECFAEPLEKEISAPTIRFKLTTMLRHSAERKTYHPSHCEMLHDAANEIERLQGIIQSHDPVAILKEIWRHNHVEQPYFLFEAIQDACEKPNERRLL